MPIYEYLCDDCATAFEKFVRYPDKDVVSCPACGTERVSRRVSSFGFPVPGKVKEPYKGPHTSDFIPHEHDD